MHSDWLTKNVNEFADWSKTKFPLVLRKEMQEGLMNETKQQAKKPCHVVPVIYIVTQRVMNITILNFVPRTYLVTSTTAPWVQDWTSISVIVNLQILSLYLRQQETLTPLSKSKSSVEKLSLFLAAITRGSWPPPTKKVNNNSRV